MTTEIRLPKIKFLCDLDDGIHWQLFLDDVWQGNFLHIETAIDHIYSLYPEELWGSQLLKAKKSHDTSNREVLELERQTSKGEDHARSKS